MEDETDEHLSRSRSQNHGRARFAAERKLISSHAMNARNPSEKTVNPMMISVFELPR